MSAERPRWVKVENGIKTPLRGVNRRFILEQKEPGVSFETAMQRYKEAWNANSLTPELVNQTWQSFWKEQVRKADSRITLQVPSCDRTSKELAELRAQNRGIILLPKQVMSLKTLLSLIPAAGADSIRNSTITNSTEDRGGCVDVEMNIDAPNKDLDSRNLKRLFESESKKGQRLATYIVASYFNKMLTGRYFDDGTKKGVALLGSKGWAYLRVNSRIFTYPAWSASLSQLGVPSGGRSEGRKQA